MHNTFLLKKDVDIYTFNKKGADISALLHNYVFLEVTPQ